jgi:hypothetical protein
MPTLLHGGKEAVLLTFSRPTVVPLFRLSVVFSSAQDLLMGLISVVSWKNKTKLKKKQRELSYMFIL